MNEVEQGIARYIGAEMIEALRGARVGVAGCGGLGSNCAMHLARLGFTRLTLVDFDRVEASNLNRQFFFARQIGEHKAVALASNLLEINPDMDLVVKQDRLTPENVNEIFADCEAVVEAVDEAATKVMLVERMLARGAFVVAASGIAGYGDTDAIVCRKAGSRLVLVGDGKSEVRENCPPLSPGVGVAAAKQADAVFAYFAAKFGCAVGARRG